MSARRHAAARDALGWVLLEVLVALGIAVAIVWWTFPKKPKPDEEKRASPDDR
jgi:hypothetical protein